MWLGVGLSVAGQLRSSAFSPASLFAGSEEGVWYDPSDLTTLFQDTAGTTPVTTPGQTVALMLDKSKGLALGPELVTNGGFDDGVTGWSGLNATIEVVDGSLVVVATGGFVGAVTQITGVGGKTYEIKIRIVSGSAKVMLKPSTDGTNNPVGNGSSPVLSAGDNTVFLTPSSDFNSVEIGEAGSPFTIDNFSVRELPGNHATQPTTAARPTYQVDAGGRGYISFDGVDDFMVTPTITPNTDKAQVFAGVRKLSDAAQAVLAETSVNAGGSNLGTFSVQAPAGASPSYRFQSRGSIFVSATSSGFAAPITNVLTGLGDISGDSVTLRIDGIQVGQSTGDQGTGNYLAYPMYIGRRGGTSLPFNGHIYSLITRFGDNLETTTIEQVEEYTAGKTGVAYSEVTWDSTADTYTQGGIGL